MRLARLPVAACLTVLAACSGTRSAIPTIPPTTMAAVTTTSGTSNVEAASLGSTYWIVGEAAVAALRDAGLSPAAVTALFNTPRTLLINGGAADPGLPRASPVRTFTSYAAMSDAFAAGTLPSTLKYALYDNENWQFTPSAEQKQPIRYAQMAMDLAHRHGVKLIFAPAINLSAGLGGGTGVERYNGYLRLRLAADGARASDVFEIQAQQAVATPAFAGFVTAAIGQARAANPTTLVLVGLSTNPAGRVLSPQDLLDAYRLTRSQVAGYWLNIPAGSAFCPSCGQPQPQVAVRFLESLASGVGP